MEPRSQAQNFKHRRTRLLLRRRADEKGLSYTQLARHVGHDLAVVSKSINHGRFPRVLQKIKEALDV